MSDTPHHGAPTRERVEEALAAVREPATGKTLGEAKLVADLDVTGGAVCYLVARGIGTTFGTYLASLVYALWTAAGVGVVLTVSAGLPYLASFASVAVSEVILLLLGNALLVRRV